MAILPPGVSAESFQSAIREFQDAVGADWVFTSDDDLHSYRDHFSYIKDQPNELIPVGCRRPRYDRAGSGHRAHGEPLSGLPLYPISTGKNFGYGGPGAEPARQRHRGSEAHEPRARG